MPNPSREQIETALATYHDVHIGTDLVSAKAVQEITVDGTEVHVDIQLGYPMTRGRAAYSATLEELIAKVDGVTATKVNVSTKILSHTVQKGVKPLAKIKNIIAVASGKGGVGKSTTAVNLALALRAEGARTGLLDADIYGPSQPRMLGAHGKPDSTDGKTLEPKRSYDIQSMSIGNLVDEETPMIWRGPMVTSALEQLLNDTNWDELDYLIVDLPPGTGDIQLTLCQRIPVSGAVIITTPQDIALLDARKGLKMFEKVDVAVLGIIENMSVHVCSACGHEEHIFGAGGGELMARQYKIELLGSLPLDMSIREGVDNGKPTVALKPDSQIAETYFEIARKIAGKLSSRAKDYTSRFPNIVIQKAD